MDGVMGGLAEQGETGLGKLEIRITERHGPEQGAIGGHTDPAVGAGGLAETEDVGRDVQLRVEPPAHLDLDGVAHRLPGRVEQRHGGRGGIVVRIYQVQPGGIVILRPDEERGDLLAPRFPQEPCRLSRQRPGGVEIHGESRDRLRGVHEDVGAAGSREVEHRRTVGADDRVRRFLGAVLIIDVQGDAGIGGVWIDDGHLGELVHLTGVPWEQERGSRFRRSHGAVHGIENAPKEALREEEPLDSIRIGIVGLHQHPAVGGATVEGEHRADQGDKLGVGLQRDVTGIVGRRHHRQRPAVHADGRDPQAAGVGRIAHHRQTQREILVVGEPRVDEPVPNRKWIRGGSGEGEDGIT